MANGVWAVSGWAALGLALACGSPEDVDRAAFPAAYGDPRGGATGDDAGTGGVGAGGAGGVGTCPEDITLLFARPGEEGGCGGLGCHVPDGTRPDLVSPAPEARLLGVPSTCSGRPYVAADDSFLAEKLDGSSPQCGARMPFFNAPALSEEDRACMLRWIAEVVEL